MERLKLQSRGEPPPGIGNLGNTCYLSATLQALAHCPAVAHYARNGCLPGEIGTALRALTRDSGSGAEWPAVVSAHALHAELVAAHPSLGGGAQQDAHEALRVLLDAAHAEAVRPSRAPWPALSSHRRAAHSRGRCARWTSPSVPRHFSSGRTTGAAP